MHNFVIKKLIEIFKKPNQLTPIESLKYKVLVI